MERSKVIDPTKGQIGTSVEGGREAPTSSGYTSTCSKWKSNYTLTSIFNNGMPKGSTEFMPKGLMVLRR